jgi:hypothetical protein
MAFLRRNRKSAKRNFMINRKAEAGGHENE